MFNEPEWIDIKCKGEQTGKEYFGRFQIKPFLSKSEGADAVRLAELHSRGIVDDMFTRAYLRLAAFLRFHVVEADAKWWLDPKDPDNVGAMNKEMLDEAPVYAMSAELDKIRVRLNPALAKKEDAKAPE